MKPALKILLLGLLSLTSGCMSAYLKSVGGDGDQVCSRIFISEYTLAWEAAVESLKTSPMDVVNRENGTLQTKWIDNTAERNLIESAGSVSLYQKAQYRFRIQIAKGAFEGRPSVRVSVQKEQQIQRDALEGWIHQPSDGIQENSMIYRIGKVMEFKARLREIENQKLKKDLEGLQAPASG